MVALVALGERLESMIFRAFSNVNISTIVSACCHGELASEAWVEVYECVQSFFWASEGLVSRACSPPAVVRVVVVVPGDMQPKRGIVVPLPPTPMTC